MTTSPRGHRHLDELFEGAFDRGIRDAREQRQLEHATEGRLVDVEPARDRRPDERHADHDRDEHDDAGHAEDRGGAEPCDEDGNDERPGGLGARVDGHHQPHGATADGIRGHALQERGARDLEDEVTARDDCDRGHRDDELGRQAEDRGADGHHRRPEQHRPAEAAPEGEGPGDDRTGHASDPDRGVEIARRRLAGRENVGRDDHGQHADPADDRVVDGAQHDQPRDRASPQRFGRGRGIASHSGGCFVRPPRPTAPAPRSRTAAVPTGSRR